MTSKKLFIKHFKNFKQQLFYPAPSSTMYTLEYRQKPEEKIKSHELCLTNLSFYELPKMSFNNFPA